MITFFVKVTDDFAYNRIMSSIVKRSVTHTKTQIGGTTSFEVIGTKNDYDFFIEEVAKMNNERGRNVAAVTEGF